MISRMTVENFKAFCAQDLSLGHLTLLTGLNGMGKSTIMQALLLLRQSWQLKMLPDVGLALNGDLIQVGTGLDARYELADSDQILFSITDSDPGRPDLVGEWSFATGAGTDYAQIYRFDGNPAIYETSLFSGRVYYLNAERLGPRVTYPMSDYKVRRLGDIGTKGEYAAHFLEAFGREPVLAAMHHDSTDNSPAISLREQVEAWLGEMSPGLRLYSDTSPETDQVMTRFGFEQRGYKSREYRATNVGFGLSYILPVLVVLLAAKPGQIVLIENPEAHLHPRGQRLMGELVARCASTGVQVIVETHSDHLLNGVRLAAMEGRVVAEQVRIHFVEREFGTDGVPQTIVHSPTLGSDGRLSDWPPGFFDEWEKSLRLLLARREEENGHGAGPRPK